MKGLFNWRYYVITLLFMAGSIGIMCAFGDSSYPETNTEWLSHRLLSAALGIVFFYALHRFVKHWEAKGEIPEFTNLKNE